jgi:ketosteroid isomerase-like protein
MSQENAGVARLAYEAFNAGDLAGWLRLHRADAELHDLPTAPDPGVHRGHEEMRTWAEAMIDMTESIRFEPQRFIEAGGCVVVPVRASAKGRGSGVPVEMTFVHVFAFTDGKIRCVRSYADEGEALEAVRRRGA